MTLRRTSLFLHARAELRAHSVFAVDVIDSLNIVDRKANDPRVFSTSMIFIETTL